MCITITSSPKKEEKVDLKLCYEFVEDVYSHWDPHGNYEFRFDRAILTLDEW